MKDQEKDDSRTPSPSPLINPPRNARCRSLINSAGRSQLAATFLPAALIVRTLSRERIMARRTFPDLCLRRLLSRNLAASSSGSHPSPVPSPTPLPA
ncbi:hypothetical protein GWI33_014605 [Rhynchophorus ferrugineus]|uniref:Uncharacterized protein n=1 Tax=Rhynchophorus ferrugineus TaxID=354439 RepID=A0A834M6R7_RHYFE|nr:hypothetical protein GWI33_014605 [Rhynchophorus ferrugineus]